MNCCWSQEPSTDQFWHTCEKKFFFIFLFTMLYLVLTIICSFQHQGCVCAWYQSLMDIGVLLCFKKGCLIILSTRNEPMVFMTSLYVSKCLINENTYFIIITIITALNQL